MRKLTVVTEKLLEARPVITQPRVIGTQQMRSLILSIHQKAEMALGCFLSLLAAEALNALPYLEK